MTETLQAFSSLARSIVVGGIYEHYKKKRYRILFLARHSESLEELVIYEALYGEGNVWARPAHMFLEEVLVDGVLQPRFHLIGEDEI